MLDYLATDTSERANDADPSLSPKDGAGVHDTTHLRILRLLVDGRARAPHEVALELGVNRENVKKHLQRCADAGEVISVGGGQYRITAAGAKARRRVRRPAPRAPMTAIVGEHVQDLRRRGLRPGTVDQRRMALLRSRCREVGTPIDGGPRSP